MSRSSVCYKFGPFELRTRTRELYRDGIKLKLRPQAFTILHLLAVRAGDLVSRTELQGLIWSGKDFGDFEQGLNNAVRELRGALSDSVAEPRYIETLPKMGYRLIVPVVVLGTPVKLPAAIPDIPDDRGSSAATAENVLARQPSRSSRRWLAVAALLTLVAAVTFFFRIHTRTTPESEPQRKVVAVLPFANLTGDASQEYFSDGLTEEMIGQLGRLDPQRLGVIARTSVMRFKQNGESMGKVGSELGAQYVLEGSVRRDADKVRISAQLIQTKDQTRIWSREYDRELSNLLALQTEIAREIAGEIRVTLDNKTPGQSGNQTSSSTVSYEAYDLYLKGLYFWNMRSSAGFEKAIGYFQQAISKDPAYALAYAGLADSYALISGYAGEAPREFRDKARAAAQRAVQLDDSLAEAHTARAVVAQSLDWDWPTAEKEYRRAVQLDPNYATAHQWFAEYLALMGRFDESAAEMEQARVLDPLSLTIATDQATALFYAQKYDAAIAQFRAVLEMDPNYGRAATIERAYLQKGMYAEANAGLDRHGRLPDENPWHVGQSVYIFARLGRPDDANRSFQHLQELDRTRPLDPLIFAHAYIGLGNKAQALNYLEKAYAEHSVSLTALNVDPIYESLRQEPRFKKLLSKMGFTR